MIQIQKHKIRLIQIVRDGMEDQVMGTLYGRIADDLRQAIRRGVYGVGDRLPSLRGVARQYQVSLGTAKEAYGNLEDEGWVRPRDRSGFFVARNAAVTVPEPKPGGQPGAPARVTLSALTLSIMADAWRPEIVNLGAGVPGPELLPLKGLARATAGAARRYPEAAARNEGVTGESGLRRQIARLMARAGVACGKEEIVITNGCQEALTLALGAVTAPGDTIAVESPTFFGVLQVAEALGLKVVELPVAYPHGVPLESVRHAVADHDVRACVLTPTFNNPTGVVIPEDEKRRIVEFLARVRVPLIEDDIFGVLGFHDARPRAARAFDSSGNTLLCSSFSKSLAPGMRLGWVMPGRFAQEVTQRKFLANISTGTLPQLALAEYLERGAYRRHMRRMTEQLRHRAARMRADVATFFPTGTRMSDPAGGMFLWVELPHRLDSEVLYRRALEQGVSILPGILFAPGDSYRSHIRLTFAAVEPEISRAAIRRLAQLLKGLPEVPVREESRRRR